jgi:N-acetylmuramoyl-L-alanine amidase
MARTSVVARTALVALIAAVVVAGLGVVLMERRSGTHRPDERRVATARVAHSRPAPAPAPTTPAPAPTTPAPAAPLAGTTIVIDPGHDGGNGQHPDQINQPVPAGGFTKACDTVGSQTPGGYTEALFNLNVGRDLAHDLQALGATVVMTRTTNDGVGPCVNQRAAIGNVAHAAATISVHADGGPAAGRGFEVIQPGAVMNAPIIGPSHSLALAVRDAYAAATGMPFADYIGSQGLDTRTDLAGLNLSTVPKVFIECGNMVSPTDAALLVTPAFQQQAARGLAAGLLTYLRHGG